MKRLAAAALLLLALPLHAHVGNINSLFDGYAGPYPVRVVVRPPGVVPGLADITVRTSSDASRVSVKPVKWDLGNAGAPPADEATRIAGEANAWSASLWLMTRGSYSVYVDVDGAKGSGRAIVPVTSVATQRLPMPRTIALLLAIFGALLAAGIVSIAGAGQREAILAPGADVDSRHRMRGRVAMIVAAIVVVLLVRRGNAWWNEVDGEYRSRLYKPFHITTTVSDLGVLDLRIDDPEWRDHAARWTPLMPDHGKLMHLFLIEETKKNAMLHLHPKQIARDHFQAQLPTASPGTYRVFADITHESGFSQTLIDRVTLPPSMGLHDARFEDPDDSKFPGPPLGAITMQPVQLRANHDVDLRFNIPDVLKPASVIEPYMGMLGHAVIVSDDFSRFVHLHPMGTISMASQMKFAERDHMPMPHDMNAMSAPPDRVVSFPFAFPKAGLYRMFVQVKINGEVITNAFDLNVAR